MTTKRHGDAVHRPGKPVEDRFEDRHESVGPGSITMLGPSDAPVDATDRCNPDPSASCEASVPAWA